MRILLCLCLLALWTLIVAGFNCTTISEHTIIVHDAIAEQAQRGAASEFAFNLKLRQPWPLVTYGQNHKYRVIKYCYTDKATRDKFHCRVQDALTVWSDKLGGFPTKNRGHSLASLEAKDPQNQIEFCAGADGTWNPKVEAGTLWISDHGGDPNAAESSIGYDIVVPSTPYRHYMKLGGAVTVDTIVHEFGHVLGMVHEMCRSDRDDYVLYQCQNVEGYSDALARAMKAENMNARDASTKLCEDWDFAQKHDFFGVEYVKSVKGYQIEDGEFDVQSIMLYGTEVFASQKCKADMLACPLLQYVKGRDRNSGLMRIPTYTVPSPRDIEWVKKWYPWVD